MPPDSKDEAYVRCEPLFPSRSSCRPQPKVATYTDPAKHAAITGAPVAIGVQPGSPFQAFNGALTGATLQITPQRLVIQSWRSTKFNDEERDSTLILAFTPEGTNGRIDLLHLDLPALNYQSVVEGWETHYWGPWRRYLAG